MNDDLPEEVRAALDDPKEDCGPFVTQIACLKVQLKLEKRLTKLGVALVASEAKELVLQKWGR